MLHAHVPIPVDVMCAISLKTCMHGQLSVTILCYPAGAGTSQLMLGVLLPVVRAVKRPIADIGKMSVV